MLIYSCTVPYYSETHRVNETNVVVLALHHLTGYFCSLLPGALLWLCSFGSRTWFLLLLGISEHTAYDSFLQDGQCQLNLIQAVYKEQCSWSRLPFYALALYGKPQRAMGWDGSYPGPIKVTGMDVQTKYNLCSKQLHLMSTSGI